MSIIRIKKARQKPYVIIDATALNDGRLSFRAKGLHTYLMAKPDDWQVRLEQLERSSPKEGRVAIRIAITELEAAGYVIRQKIRGERGRMAGWDTTVYETAALARGEGIETDNSAPIGLIAQPTTDLPTSVPPTSVPPTSVPPTSVPPTSVPPTSVPPTSANQQLLSIDSTKHGKEPSIEKSIPPQSPFGDDVKPRKPRHHSTDEGIRLAADWYPTKDDQDWARQKNYDRLLDLQTETEQFRNYWHTLVPTAKNGYARKLDWSRTWQNRIIDRAQAVLSKSGQRSTSFSSADAKTQRNIDAAKRWLERSDDGSD